MTETDVVGFEGYYTVTAEGNVQNAKGYSIHQWTNHRGYKLCTLHKKGHRKHMQVHRIVAEAFIPNPDNHPQVDHIDGNKSNNCVNNLRWVTSSGNCLNPSTRYKLHTVGCKYFYKGEPGRVVAERNGIHPKTFSRRILRGWSIEDACTKPMKGHKNDIL